MPITPDLIRFNEPGITSPVAAATLPRTKSEYKNNNNYSAYEADVNKAASEKTSATSNSTKSNSLRPGLMNPGWNDSWNHVVNDFKSTKTINAVPTPMPPPVTATAISNPSSHASTIPDKLGGEEDLIKLEDSSLEASVQKYEDLLREYGLYDFYSKKQ